MTEPRKINPPHHGAVRTLEEIVESARGSPNVTITVDGQWRVTSMRGALEFLLRAERAAARREERERIARACHHRAMLVLQMDQRASDEARNCAHAIEQLPIAEEQP